MDELLGSLQAAFAGWYTIERQLGRGGMAVVYLARDLKHDRYVALKLLRPELAGSIGPERFLREIHIAAGLQHPHILPLYDSGEAAGRLYYVMPYVEGESLRERLAREKQLPLEDAVQITREVAEGLSYAHTHGVVHRDIKPANILLAGGHAVIADFGIARALSAAATERLTDSGLTVGTPAYMSPEQAGGEATIDGRSDLYSLGSVLYEMLAGEPPFTGPNSQAVLARILQEPPRALHVVRPTVPLRVERAVKKALAKIPADRFATAAQFAEALTLEERRRPRVRAAALAAFLTVLVAAGGWAAWRRWGRTAPAGEAALDPTHIAVLYFADRSEDRTLRHVAHGLTEELIDELGRVKALHLVPPSGVRPYSEKDIPLDSIARALRVGTLVEGSVERPGDRLRVRVRLIDAGTGEQLESGLFDRPWGDLFALQREIADSVSRFLRERLGREIRLREQRAGTRSVAAWELVRRADELTGDADALERSGDPSAASRLLRQADSLLARAERLDSKWIDPILARGWLARTQMGLAEGDSTEAWLRTGLGYAERGLRITPHDPRALELRGTLRYGLWRVHQGDSAQAASFLAAAEQDLTTATAADPGLARAWNALSMLYYQRGDWTRADLTLRRALEADAYLSETAYSMQVLLFASLERGDSAGARSWCDTGRARFPGDHRFLECELSILGWIGRTAGAAGTAWRFLREIEQRDTASLLAEGWAIRRLMIAAILARAGLADSARGVIRATRAGVPSPDLLETLGLYEAFVRTELGEYEVALRLLQEYLVKYPTRRAYVARTRWFQPLRGNPRFDVLVQGGARP